jgi:hypothetical protein
MLAALPRKGSETMEPGKRLPRAKPRGGLIGSLEQTTGQASAVSQVEHEPL